MIYALCSQFGQADTIYEAILRLNKRMFLGVLRCRGNRETCCTAMSRQRKARKLDPADWTIGFSFQDTRASAEIACALARSWASRIWCL